MTAVKAAASEAMSELITVDDFMEFDQESPLTKLDVLACVASFVWEKEQRLAKEKKLKRPMVMADDHDPILMATPLNVCFSGVTPKKKRSSLNIDLNQEPPLRKPKKEAELSLITQEYLQPKKKTYNKGAPLILREIPESLKEMMEGMNGSEALLVAEKPLTNSDVNKNLSRLQMPQSQVVNAFLTEEEMEFLKGKVGKNKNKGIEVPLHQLGGGGEGHIFMVNLKRWEMPKSNSVSIMYALITEWNDVVTRNKLRSGEVVQVWSFRVGHKLHLALLVLRGSDNININ